MLLKNYKKSRFIALLLVVAVSLFACSDGEHLRDLHAYVEKMKKAIVKNKRKDIIADIKLPVAVVFEPTGKQRDPFEQELASYSGGAANNNPRIAFPVKLYEFIGTISRDQKDWAIIKAPDNNVYQMTINDRIGDHYGIITSIHADHLEVEEELSAQEMGTTGQGTSKRLVTLQLKGGN